MRIHIHPLRSLLVWTCLSVLAACGGDGGPDDTGGPGAPGAAPDGAARAQEAPRRFNITDLGHTAGDPEAAIRVVEFSDFGCPHCREFHLGSYPTVHEDFVETGLVQWKYIPFVLGAFPNSVAATRAGECAIAQDAFPALRDRIFEEQGVWINSDDPASLFVQYAEEEGLDGGRLRTCIDDGERDDNIQQNIEVGRQIGIRGTPTFIIDGSHVQGNRPPEFFRQVFSALLNPDSAQAAAEAAGASQGNGTPDAGADAVPGPGGAGG